MPVFCQLVRAKRQGLNTAFASSPSIHAGLPSDITVKDERVIYEVRDRKLVIDCDKSKGLLVEYQERQPQAFSRVEFASDEDRCVKADMLQLSRCINQRQCRCCPI